MQMKPFYFLFIAFVFTTCLTQKDNFTLPEEEFNKFHTEKYEIFYEGKAVASYEIMELEYYDGKLIKEYSLTQYQSYPVELTEKIMRYMHMRYPDAKIEVKFKGNSSQDDD